MKCSLSRFGAFETHTGIMIIPEAEQHPTIVGVSLIIWISGRKHPVNIFFNLLQILELIGSECLQLRCHVVQFNAHSK